MFFETKPKAKSSLGFKYPILRDHILHTSNIWLEGKRSVDRAEGLWRIHDGLYDLENFIDKHPGGRDWLQFTKVFHYCQFLMIFLSISYFINFFPKFRNKS